MAATHYIMHVTSQGSDAKYKISYKQGKFFRLEHKSGKLATQQFRDKLLMIVPEYESGITDMILKYSDGRVNYEATADQKKESLYTQIVDAYFEFYETESGGLKARFGATEGKVIKEIITYFKQSCTTSVEVIDTWNLILSQWNKLEDFYAKQIELKQINSNLNTILRQIKDGKPASKAKNRAKSNADDLRESI